MTKVFILHTCPSPIETRFSTFVFATLRVGFPTAQISVYVNGTAQDNRSGIYDICNKLNAFTYDADTIHHEWIEELVWTQNEPFWLVDCDIQFFSKVEDWTFDTPLAGWRIPEFDDEFSGCITRARLHPSLLFVDPVKVRAAIKDYESKIADTIFTPKVNLFYPLVNPINQRRYFSDTLSLLYNAIGGTAFTDVQLDAYFHFFFGACFQIVLPRLKNWKCMAEWREVVLKNPELGRGAWRSQMLYYDNRQPTFDGVDVIAPGTLQESQEATKWRNELCKGDTDAMNFCELWFCYVHIIDDLLDSMLDGRPRMSKDQILTLFLRAAVIYNCPFFVRHREILFPIVMLITTTYADSVHWETSPDPNLRIMADTLRMAGNDMYCMVALIVGGPEHRNYVSRRIKEIDYRLQHDSAGRPI